MTKQAVGYITCVRCGTRILNLLFRWGVLRQAKRCPRCHATGNGYVRWWHAIEMGGGLLG